ncbi:MAG: site-specific integrase [Gemmatimonadota bacterium]
MRNPQAQGWPKRGDRTEIEEVAHKWKWDYLALIHDEGRRDGLGLRKPYPTLADGTERYLMHRMNTVERMTWSADRTAVNHLRDRFPLKQHMDRIAPDDVQTFVGEMLAQGYKPSTLGTYIASWRRLFARFGDYDPCADLELPNPGTTDVATFDAHDVERILDAADAVDRLQVGRVPSARLAVEIGLYMGLRQGEIFALTWEDIDPDTKTVRVQWQQPKDRLGRKPTKGKYARTALILPGWWNDKQRGFGLMVGRDGKPSGSRTQSHLITRVLDTSGLNQIGRGWHVLRHTYSRMFLEAGGSLEQLQKSLGHSSITTTEQVYGHLREDTAARLAMERIYGA